MRKEVDVFDFGIGFSKAETINDDISVSKETHRKKGRCKDMMIGV